MQPFTYTQQVRFIRCYIVLFYVLAFCHLLTGMWLYQLQPVIFQIKPDVAGWLLMQTGIHQWLLHHSGGLLGLDILFHLFPLLFWMGCIKGKWPRWVVCVPWLIVNWVYILSYVVFPSTSIEAYLPSLLFPFLFLFAETRPFYLLMHGCRYLFLYFFATAGIWKIRQGSAFNVDQMSGILLEQHKEFLVSNPGHWYSSFLYFLITHPVLSYCLFAAAILLELIFIVGFFTKKYDRLLLGLFFLFLFTNYLVMHIGYFELIPLSFPLFFSAYKLANDR